MTSHSRQSFIKSSLASASLGVAGKNSLFSAQDFAPEQVIHQPAKAKSIIYLFMAGAPSQLELFEDKPILKKYHGKATPESYLKGKQFAFLKPSAKLMGSAKMFKQYGQSGATLSTLLPHHQKIVDEVCFIKSMTTDVFNHGPAKIFMNTGFPQPGRPSLGAWLSYGLGAESQDLPGFAVLQSGPRGPRAGSALWSSGFIPSEHQGVTFRSKGDPVLHLSTPKGISDAEQKKFIQQVNLMNKHHYSRNPDPQIKASIHAYNIAHRMQFSAPPLVDLSNESKSTLDLYGCDPQKPSFARNCLMARRMVERGVRTVQLYHSNWDHHGGPGETIEKDLPQRCQEVDQASAALVLDLKQRGLLDETLVVWGGEFGRTPMGEVRGSIGRDHHIDAFTIWMAGGGIKKGMTYGKTDDLGYGVIDKKVHVHDLHATIMHLMGIQHKKLTYRFQGRDFRLTDVHGKVIKDILT
jgi:hypothetical protein